MELAGAPLGEDLLSGLGEHLLRDPGQRILGVAEDEYGAAGDRGAEGDDGGSAPEWPSRVGVEHCASDWSRIAPGLASGRALEAGGEQIG